MIFFDAERLYSRSLHYSLLLTHFLVRHIRIEIILFCVTKKGKYVKVSAATALVPSAGGGGELSPAAVPPAPVGAPRVAQIMR